MAVAWEGLHRVADSPEGMMTMSCNPGRDQLNPTKRSRDHVDEQRLNPFSGDFDFEHAMAVRARKGEQGYGRPLDGTATAERGRRAQRHVLREVDEMVLIIGEVGVRGEDGRARVTFGRLFERYVRVSDKVVGILLRARKHGHVHFEGEMLWQGQDDGVVITLLA
ncbi:unnamed protein product [Lampetra planeri]